MTVKQVLLVAVFSATAFSSSIFSEESYSLADKIEQLELKLQTISQLQLQMNMQLLELQKEVKEFRGVSEEHQFKLKQIEDRQRDLYRDIERRFSSLKTQTADISKTDKTINQKSVNKPTKPVKQSELSSDQRKEFEAAFLLVRNKKYSQAVTGFNTFLEKYPNGSYAGNARFWIGQVHLVQANFNKAAKEFERLRKEFPQSPKLPAATIKLADIKVKQKKWGEAKALYQEVIEKYNDTALQQLARKGLQAIPN